MLLILTMFALYSYGQECGLVAPGARMEAVSSGFAFTEGPAADSRGDVYFTDQPNDRIWKYSETEGLTLFLEGTGRANGLYFDRDGNLVACSDMENEIWSIAPDGTHTVLLSGYDGGRLNGPNDLWVHPGGGIYFTDPLYVRDYWERDAAMEQDGEHVYYIAPGRNGAVRVDEGLVKPNGIIGSPDGRTLYVADIGAGKTYAYDIALDGMLVGKRLRAEMGSDGMTLDDLGNLYLTGDGVTVFNPQGRKICHIEVDAPWTANVCFGGGEMNTLFITASQHLYTLRMNVRGVR